MIFLRFSAVSRFLFKLEKKKVAIATYLLLAKSACLCKMKLLPLCTVRLNLPI